MRRVVITGGAGFIGTHLARRLRRDGDDVTVLDVVPARDPQASAVRASVLDGDALHRHLKGADLVVHLAGFVRDGMRRAPADGATLQIQGTINVLEACHALDVGHLAYASSFYVYDGLPAEDHVDETTPLDPRRMELFGSCKLMGEALCHEWARERDLSFTVFRLGPVYGHGGSSAVGDFITTGLQGKPIEVWGAGERRNQYTYVEDVAAALAAGLDRPGRTYNVVSPERTSIKGLAELLSSELGFEFRFDESRPEGPSFPYISSQKAIDELGWTPLDLRDGVRRTVEHTAAELGLPTR